METRLEQNRSAHKTAAQKKLLLFFLAAAAGVALFFALFFRGVYVGNSDMAPCLMQGDVVLAGRFSAYWRGLGPGDLAVVKEEEGTRVLRVVAQGPARVAVYEGRVYVDGCLLEEGYASGEAAQGEYVLSAQQVFLLPDARENTPGLVLHQTELQGRVLFRVAPLGRIAAF